MGGRGGVRALKDRVCMPTQQPDAALSQDNPVSNTLYTVLDTTRNVVLESIDIMITWGVTQPTPLVIVVTVDGQVITYSQADPVTATSYNPALIGPSAEANQTMTNNPNVLQFYMAMLRCSGRSVKVQAKITWGVTQPTPLVCRVKWSKW